MCTALMLSPLAGCGSLGELPGALAHALGTASAAGDGSELEIDAGGAIEAARVPVSEDRVPPRARTAARSIQPGGDRVEVAREEGPFGSGFRWSTRYGDQVRTVLVSGEGRVLHKTWQIPATETPPEVLRAAARTCPGEIVRVEASQGPGPGADYHVTARGPDGVLRQWRGDTRDRGRTYVEASIRVRTVSGPDS